LVLLRLQSEARRKRIRRTIARILLLRDSVNATEEAVMSELAGRRALVVGGSRGFGRGIAEGLLSAGATVHVLARDAGPLAELTRVSEGRIRTHVGDAGDAELCARLLDEVQPHIVVVNAGAQPPLAPLHRHSWDSFSTTWNSDVKIVFTWLRQILNRPLPSGSQVLVMSSGAALHGSPASGGYAGAKATVRFMAQYAAEESRRAQLGIRVAAILPRLTPATELGRAAVKAYAERAGRSEAEQLAVMGPTLTPALVATAVLRLLDDRTLDAHAAFALDADNLTPLS
jgi:NAD(P)-dependent dehydrogenase (short-subunit alcohol dehydrogenase family)